MQILVKYLVKYIGYPLAQKLVGMFISSIEEMYMVHKLENIKEEKKKRRLALTNAIKNAKDNNERKELSILLHQHTIGKLPNS